MLPFHSFPSLVLQAVLSSQRKITYRRALPGHPIMSLEANVPRAQNPCGASYGLGQASLPWNWGFISGILKKFYFPSPPLSDVGNFILGEIMYFSIRNGTSNGNPCQRQVLWSRSHLLSLWVLIWFSVNTFEQWWWHPAAGGAKGKSLEEQKCPWSQFIEGWADSLLWPSPDLFLSFWQDTNIRETTIGEVLGPTLGSMLTAVFTLKQRVLTKNCLLVGKHEKVDNCCFGGMVDRAFLVSEMLSCPASLEGPNVEVSGVSL